MITADDVIKRAALRLEQSNKSRQVLIGFDGFVDEIIHVVDKRKSPDEYVRIKDIMSFSERIASVAGLSANIELVPVQTKLGGNGPIMANAMIAQQHEVSYIGALGAHFIHPVFRSFADACRKVVSLTEPGYTDALEFYDGKLLLGKMNNLVDVSLEKLLEKLPEDELRVLLTEVDLIAFTNWTMLSNLNGIIEFFSEIMAGQDHKPLVFLDLADPKKRTTADIREVLRLIAGIPCPATLSMNKSESAIIAQVLGIKEEDILSRAVKIREKTGIHCIVIHPLEGAAVAHPKEAVWVDGPYTSKPKLTTGAGDNFNAGFCGAWLGGLMPGECLAAGVSSSGYYVRNAQSASRNELLRFMNKWSENGLSH